jgi:quinol monooxygenase YgiN
VVQMVESTADMRREIAQRLERWDPKRSVVLTGEYHIPDACESRFVAALEALAAATRSARGLEHFNWHTPIGTKHPGRMTVFHTYEEWTTAADFLNQWNSDHLSRFQRAAGSLSVRSTLELAAGGGAEPAAVGPVIVLRTGQTDSWDEKGELRKKDDRAGDDGYWEQGATSAAPRFRDNNDNGTITDTKTDLVWLRNANLFGEVPWATALDNAAHLAAGAPGLNDGSKRGDWRLPNVNEMQSLLDLNNTFGPALPTDAPFINLEATNYWTSSSVALAPALGWFVALAVGPPVFDLKMNRMRMWPVRGRTSRVAQTGQQQCFGPFGQPQPCRGTGQDGELRSGASWPAVRFTDNDDGTVTDHLTGLVWLQNADAFGRLPWQAALDACDALASGDKDLDDDSKAGDWRLPNLNELRSLIDYSEKAPALPKPHPFSNVRSSLYWSSTTVASAPRFARFVFVGVGPSVWDSKSVRMTVWPVRNAR